MTTAIEVIDAFINGSTTEMFGDDLILKDQILFAFSRDWPLAIHRASTASEEAVVIINLSRRGENVSPIELLASRLSATGFPYRLATFEFIKSLVDDRGKTPTQFESLVKQLDDEKAAHEATRAELTVLSTQLSEVTLERDELSASISTIETGKVLTAE
jgi:hypothetical protein